MASVKLKFRASANHTKEGSLYFQVIHGRMVRHIGTEYHVMGNEWNELAGEIVIPQNIPEQRKVQLRTVRDNIKWQQRRLNDIIARMTDRGYPYTVEEVVSIFNTECKPPEMVFNFFRRQIAILRQMGRTRTAETYQETLSCLMKFRQHVDLHFDAVTREMTTAYETWMRTRRLCRNTTSFYMRVLRTVYNKAVNEGLTVNQQPFRHVYTGIDKTNKRALTFAEIRKIKNADISHSPSIDLARDLFLFSFYLRGIPPIDLAFLRKSDLNNGFVQYNRHKTGQLISIHWEKPMQDIIDKYPDTGTQFMLPIIRREDGTEMQQYRNMMRNVNCKLKKLSAILQLTAPLTMYVARHSWASIAQSNNVPISVICGALGHDSEMTTQIYLASIQNSRIDEANFRILNKLKR